MKTNKGLVEYAKAMVQKKTVYMWGSFGQRVTDIFISQKTAQYKDWYTTARVNKFKGLVGQGVYAFDCVGLIKSYVWGGVDKHTYVASQDKSANGMYQAAKVKGDISNIPETPGVLVWMSGHIGVYIGNGEVIEATPSWQDGVQLTKLSQRNWTAWCECPYIEYIKEEVFSNIKIVEVYNRVEELPAYAQATIQKLVSKGYLNGDSKGLLGLTTEMVRVFIVNDRAGLYDR